MPSEWQPATDNAYTQTFSKLAVPSVTYKIVQGRARPGDRGLGLRPKDALADLLMRMAAEEEAHLVSETLSPPPPVT